ncbi:two-component system, OmpR family, osmolarity sensor histidine kinase EnvZ [Azospirillaceae bacterium]
MFRRWADGIAARTAWTVVLALLVTQAISALVYLTDRGEPQPVHHLPVLIQRISAIAQLVESTAVPNRMRTVRAVDDPILGVEWRPDRPQNVENRIGSGAERLRKRLRAELGDPSREIILEVNRESTLGILAAAPWNAPHASPIRMRLFLALTDGSWLIFVTNDPLGGPFRLLRFGLWMGLIGLAVTGLSLWAAQRITAPLAAFAQAAERLSVDGQTHPLPEAGPRELRAAARALNGMQDRLRRFIEDRTQMLAAISHDLRTPLTRLRLRAELIEDTAQQQRILADLDEMEAMISSTLAFARDDAQKEPRVAADLADLLQSLCEDRNDAGFEADYQGVPHLSCRFRPIALRRAFGNLIDNAIYYGGGACVRLEIEDGQILVLIEDQGPGIPDSESEKVFQPFYRLERSRNRNTGGAGLGLSVARTIIRGHGGDVVLRNRPEGGLCVSVFLPN